MKNNIILWLLRAILMVCIIGILPTLIRYNIKNILLYIFCIIIIVITCTLLTIIKSEIDIAEKFAKDVKLYEKQKEEEISNLHKQYAVDFDNYLKTLEDLKIEHTCAINDYEMEINKLNNLLDNPILITDIFDLYQASLVIRKYNVHKYVIERQSKEVHIYCNMQTYTKMSINKEILPNVKYHIDGTNVIL